MVPILGRPMLYYSLTAFDLTPSVERMVVAVPPGLEEEFKKEIRFWGFSKPVEVVPGGAVRSESVFHCLTALRLDPPDLVLVHDAARPCVSREMIELLLNESAGSPATLGSAVVDTLRNFDSAWLAGELERSQVVALETPQLFPFERLLQLHESSNEDLPDDTTLFTRAGEKVKVVFHRASNIKVTFPEDVAAAEGILFARGWQDVSEGED